MAGDCQDSSSQLDESSINAPARDPLDFDDPVSFPSCYSQLLAMYKAWQNLQIN